MAMKIPPKVRIDDPVLWMADPWANTTSGWVTATPAGQCGASSKSCGHPDCTVL